MSSSSQTRGRMDWNALLSTLIPLRLCMHIMRGANCIHAACRRGKRKPVPFATVVTDLTTCHNTWFHPLVDRCFVPTLYCKRSAMKNGLKEEQARLRIPIDLCDLISVLHVCDVDYASPET